MAEVIRQSDLRNNNAEIMRRVADGESFTVTVHGHAVADLVPHQRVRRRRLIPAADLDQLIADAGPPPDAAQWARDIAESDELFGDDQPGDDQPGDDRYRNDPYRDPWERGSDR